MSEKPHYKYRDPGSYKVPDVGFAKDKPKKKYPVWKLLVFAGVLAGLVVLYLFSKGA